MQRYPALMLLALATLLLTGCTSDRVPVEGTVTFDGQPVEKGTIAFEPADGKGPATGGQVIDGRYSLSGEASPTPGEKIVRISATRKTGRMVPAVPEPGTDQMIEEIKPYIPANYNHQTTLRCTVTKDHARHDFTLVSQPEESPQPSP